MIEYRTGNIFESEADYLVCPVNCVGTMGKGLALEFKKRFPKLDGIYQLALRHGVLTTRQVYRIQPEILGQGIILFATKWHWKEPSEMTWISGGLRSLRDDMHFWHDGMDEEVYTYAIPKLGCGLGGLEWDDVKYEIDKILSPAPENVRILVYE